MRFDRLIPPIALLTAACASSPDPSISQYPGIVHGYEMARQYCASCHAIGTSGSSPHSGAIPFRKLSTLYPVDSIGESLVEGLMTGHPDMPEYQFSAEAADDFIAYLESIQQN